MDWIDRAFGLGTEKVDAAAPASKPKIKAKLESLWVTIRNPSGDPSDFGSCEAAYYRVNGDTLILCDAFGDPAGQPYEMQPGENPRQAAARLKLREWRTANPTSDFWRPLRYQRDGGVV
jgi:hypothetical protein